MTKLNDGTYLVLTPTKYGPLNESGVRTVRAFRVSQMRRTMPGTESGEVAVRLNLSIDSSVFEALVPVVNIELEEHDTFINVKAEVLPPPEADE